jgi:hypothetical protein
VDFEEDRRRFDITLVVVQAYVYDHRFAPAMKTEILRRTRRELMAHGILTLAEGTAHSEPHQA